MPLASATPMALVILVLKKRVSMARVSGCHFLITSFALLPMEKSLSGRASFESVLKHSENKSFGLARSSFITAKPMRSNPGSIAKIVSDRVGIDILDFIIVFEFFNQGF